jgi:hypothetical protein
MTNHMLEAALAGNEIAQKLYPPATSEAVDVLLSLGYRYLQTDKGLSWVAPTPKAADNISTSRINLDVEEMQSHDENHPC